MDKNQTPKYIYSVYKNINGEYHAERFKIVYRIKNKIFFHKPSSEHLDSIDINAVKEYTLDNLYKIRYNGYFFERPDEEALKNLRKEVRKNNLSDSIIMFKNHEKSLLNQLENVRIKIKETSEELLKYKEE